jgi:asparagine synthase (glutamine-hydrolysing)
MAAAVPHRAVDGTTYWWGEQAGLAYLSLIVTPESQHEHQPYVEGNCVIIADARIDNRSELTRTLNLTSNSLTDAGLILAAYHYWGLDCLQHIIGDFAFVIWDSQRKRVLLARDPMAMRPLYYRLEEQRLLFATEVKQIIAAHDVPVEINEPALAAFFAGPNMPPEWTFYKGIEQLPAGHALIVEEGQHRLWQFWDVDPSYRIQYKNEEDYLEHFRELFKEAVECRLRSIKPVGLLLSGGMDSASVAATVGGLFKTKSTQTFPPFLTFCHAFTEFPECDERYISSLIVNHFGFPTMDVRTEDAWPLKDYPAHGPDRDDPYLGAFQALIEFDLAIARDRNVGVLISADRGNLLTDGWEINPWGMLLTGRWAALRRDLQAESEFYGRSMRRTIYNYFVSSVISNLWPEYTAPHLRETVRRLLGRKPRERTIYPFWVCEDFAQRINLKEIVLQNQHPPSPIRASGRKWRYEMIFAYMHMRGMVWSERTFARFGINFADPWSDRRLVSFVLAIPTEMINHPSEYKRLTRNAMRGIMPESARQQVRKILPSPYYLSAIREKARDTILYLIDNSIAHENGYIDKSKIRIHNDDRL